MKRDIFICVILLSLVVEKSFGCFCDHYPWSSWSTCSKTCNFGTQSRTRAIVRDDYYNKNFCDQLCQWAESRACSQQACPINCQLGDWEEWSECDPCVKKQFRVKSLLQPSQFGGQDSCGPMVDDRPCFPEKLCNVEEVNCGNKFQCDNGRCIARKLECNGENDCGDNSDEQNCRRIKVVCTSPYQSIPSVHSMGFGYHILAGETRGEVLDYSFNNGSCVVLKSEDQRTRYRLPANLYNITFEVKTQEDDVITTSYTSLTPLVRSYDKASSSRHVHWDTSGIPYFWGSISTTTSTSSYAFKQAMKASQKMSSKYIRIHKVFAVSNFMAKKQDLQLSNVFLNSLKKLPLEYNYALYSQIFDNFGTHYYTSGILGAKYDLLYQFSEKEIKNSGKWVHRMWVSGFQIVSKIKSESKAKYCSKVSPIVDLVKNFPCSATKRFNLREAFSEYMRKYDPCLCAPCPNNAQPVLSETGCLCVCKSGTYGSNCELRAPDYKSDAVDGYWSCWSPWSACDASFKRQRTRLCNNPEPMNGGKPCKGDAEDEERCFISMFKSQGATCVNDDDYTEEGRIIPKCDTGCFTPEAPENGFIRNEKPCYDVGEQAEVICFSGHFRSGYPFLRCLADKTWAQPQNVECQILVWGATCVNDDDYTEEGRIIPKCDTGCFTPEAPENGFIRNEKPCYDVGEQAEVICFSGHFRSGYPFLRCLADKTWAQPQNVECQRLACDRPSVSEAVHVTPFKIQYDVGDQIHLTCPRGYSFTGLETYVCGDRMSWIPAILNSLECKKIDPLQVKDNCSLGKKEVDSHCVCISPEEDCNTGSEGICVLDVQSEQAVTNPSCRFLAEKCRNDEQVHFIHNGPCNDDTRLTWAIQRANLSANSRKKEPCGYDVCYDWERCSEERLQCTCLLPNQCPKGEEQVYCIQYGPRKQRRTSTLCVLGAMRCASARVTLLHPGKCVP
ncbi:PREDICTED: complement component C6-like [Thamnophis sirtalis]|uniref:Complement component C6-like n=1 Tax=Thamnophis sirtalis TaxID=35019 RepID=A0A6I9Y1B3_9SAUR|nr:PREDICTED: complement component C6-like [Thamnophis sirtalis]